MDGYTNGQDPYGYGVTYKESKKSSKGPFIGGLFLGLFIAAVIVLLSLAAAKALGYTVFPEDTELLSAENQRRLSEIRNQINSSYLYGTDGVDFETGILKGYVDALGDPYSVYYTEEEYQELINSMSGSYSGIGVVVQQAETGIISVVKVYEDSPGEAAGMLAGDIIYAVEGEQVTGVDLTLVTSRIKGAEGTKVNLTVYRSSTGEYLDMEITRKKIDIQTVSHRMLDTETGYISMDSFAENSADEFEKAYKDLKAQGMRALVFDIRDNGGGLLNTAIDLADLLLPKGLVTYTEDKNGKGDSYYSRDKKLLDVPMALLVNGNSASASEVLTGALMYYKACTVVGSRTFGKGIVQTIMRIDSQTALKITTSRYFTPAGVCIHGEGIVPDLEVKDDPETEADDQLQAAIGLLKDTLK